MIGPAGFGQAPSEPAECAEWELVEVEASSIKSLQEFSLAEICAAFNVPLPVEPGHVMSKEAYERLVLEQQK